MTHDTVIRLQSKNRGDPPVIDRSQAVEEARRCFSCRYYVATMEGRVRRCKHEESGHFNRRHMIGCEFWELWK